MNGKGIVLYDVGYEIIGDTTFIKLYGKKENIPVKRLIRYEPYFYAKWVEEEKLKKTKFIENDEIIEVKRIEKVKKYLYGKEEEFYKVYASKPSHIPKLKSFIKHNYEGQCYEYDITFRRRFLYDFQITPLDMVIIEEEGEEIKDIIEEKENNDELIVMAFDIEVFNPKGVPDPKKDEIISISFYTKIGNGVISTKGDESFIIKVKNEKEMLEKFVELIKYYKIDVLVGFNSSSFDIPYIIERMKKYKMDELTFIRNEKPSKIRKGLSTGYNIPGIIHFDLYPIVRLFGGMGVIGGINRFTLEEVYKTITKKEKKMVDRLNIWEMWEKGEVKELLEYSLGDAKSTFEVAEYVLPLAIELSKLTKVPLGETALSTSGQFVENLLMFNATRRNEIIPSKPSYDEIRKREFNPVEGAFVKLPEPGIYENIAVLDFRGLYPSIIISYNIDPNTIVEEGEAYESPIGIKFRKDKLGLIPETLKELVETRAKIKDMLKKMDKHSEQYQKLSAKSQALKIISNSFYGYLGYARSRWYNRDCAASVTAFGRKHIKEAWEKSEKEGFEVLYIDTDSLFLLMKGKSKEDVLKFLENINNELPGSMELELEGFYKRGIFVSKKSGAKGAKKKYALLGEDGSIKIRGFELVRRDWSKIARELQRKVLEVILEKGSKEEAVNIVKQYIKKLRKGEVELKELAIMTQLNKPLGAYEVISPELSAALKLKKAGREVGRGMIIEYVIGKRGNTISEKATPLELAEDYDAEYYINNQIIPAVMKILKELGVDEKELDRKGQSSLSEFF